MCGGACGTVSNPNLTRWFAANPVSRSGCGGGRPLEVVEEVLQLPQHGTQRGQHRRDVLRRRLVHAPEVLHGVVRAAIAVHGRGGGLPRQRCKRRRARRLKGELDSTSDLSVTTSTSGPSRSWSTSGSIRAGASFSEGPRQRGADSGISYAAASPSAEASSGESCGCGRGGGRCRRRRRRGLGRRRGAWPAPRAWRRRGLGRRRRAHGWLGERLL